MERTVETNELNLFSFHPSLSWRSIIAGLLVSFFVFGILLSLGVAIGGVSLADGASLRASGTFSGLWVVLSILISLFIASYFTARISNFDSSRVGMAQGFVLSALFVGVLLWQVANLAGWMTRSASSAVGSAVEMGGPAAQQTFGALGPALNDMVEDNLAGLDLRQDPQVIGTGIASRLLRGDTEAAKAYLARNSNLTVAEVNARIDELQARLQQAGNDARVATAQAMKVSGWSLFAIMVLSLIGGLAGGLMGSRSNQRAPVSRPDLTARRPRPAFT